MRTPRRSRIHWRTTLCAFALLGLAPATAGGEVSLLSPQPDAAMLKPGLGVTYYYDYYKHINQVVRKIKRDQGIPGEPLPWLNYRVGADIVLTADRDDGVGAHIQGLIHLDEKGTYLFALQSNDGVRLSIGGEQLLEDPGVHVDSWSEVATVEVTEPGWYPLEVLYFERRNTSTLRLVWKNPTIGKSGEFVPVPEKAYAHLPIE